MKKTVLIFAAAAMVSILSNAAHAAGMKEGQWSMTMTTKVAGMEAEMDKASKEMENMSAEDKAMMQKMMGGMGMNIQAGGGGMTMTMKQCLTNDNPVPQREDQKCQETHTMKGNTVNFEAVCPDGTSKGQITFKNDSMKGSIVSTTNGQEATMDISGEYVGPCDQALNESVSEKLSKKELELKEKELQLRERELNLKEQQMGQVSTDDSEQKSASTSHKPSLNDVNNAVNTTNNVKNTFGNFRSLFGR